MLGKMRLSGNVRNAGLKLVNNNGWGCWQFGCQGKGRWSLDEYSKAGLPKKRPDGCRVGNPAISSQKGGNMDYALSEIKRIIDVATKDTDWDDKYYLFSEIEKFIHEVKIREGMESPEDSG